MAKLKVPSLQHLARNWRQDPYEISRTLVRLSEHPPSFNYNPLYSAIWDLVALRVPYHQVVEGIERNVKRQIVRENLVSILPLVRDHFADVAPDFVQSVAPRKYSVGRGLMVPFGPPMLYGVDGRLFFHGLASGDGTP